MDAELRDALDTLAQCGEDYAISAALTIRTYIKEMEARVAVADECLTVSYLAGVQKGRETAEARVSELEAHAADRESEIDALKFERDRAEGLLRDAAPFVDTNPDLTRPGGNELRERIDAATRTKGDAGK